MAAGKTMDLTDLLELVQALYVTHGEIPVVIRSESRRQCAALVEVLAENDETGSPSINLVFESLQDKGALHA
jgi:hypothetical protein